jgi:hypothetical protein
MFQVLTSTSQDEGMPPPSKEEDIANKVTNVQDQVPQALPQANNVG